MGNTGDRALDATAAWIRLVEAYCRRRGVSSAEILPAMRQSEWYGVARGAFWNGATDGDCWCMLDRAWSEARLLTLGLVPAGDVG